ncbi:hypothetical protein BC749_102783 [Flavobacterium araucananum]|uniref:Uncharacterized protein n=1 Tax=Flavobacterium araucananum TaxID=946678 RepID=A0A227P363_9FLAO|nr:hypothetical protein [Flavobacterium araucananum]OXG04390.1 hypothetical protein B0A64_15225 [Flavobacterium araucananum]PWK01210.1 hypothetical protein BC749_102783 [Flavobacterium araucananum]
MNYLDYSSILPELDKTNDFIFESLTSDFSNPEKVKKIRQTREISITRYQRDGNEMLFHVFLSDIKIKSNMSVENIFFLKKTGSAFDEIELEINEYGKIIKVLNFEELKERWKIVSAKLAIDNIGLSAESYRQNITEIVKEERKLLSFFSDYKMFGLYFSSLYRNSYAIERKRKLLDCKKAVITEHFYPKDEKFDTYLVKAAAIEDNQDTDFIKYDGIIEYRKDQIDLATIEVEKEKKTILYNIYKTTL